MKILKHELYQCFEKHLFSALIEDEGQEEFVQRVAEEYLQDLVDKGYIALHQIDSVLEEVEEEVRDMLRMKTYGYYSLQTFRDSAMQEKKRRGQC